MNLASITKEKGIAFLEGIPELRVHMVKESIPMFFVELTVPMRRGAYDFEFPMILLMHKGVYYISIISLAKFMFERAKQNGTATVAPFTNVHPIFNQIPETNAIAITEDNYGYSKARWIFYEYFPGDMDTIAKQGAQYKDKAYKFLPINNLSTIDPLLTKINMDLSSANITKNIYDYIEGICGTLEVPEPIPRQRQVAVKPRIIARTSPRTVVNDDRVSKVNMHTQTVASTETKDEDPKGTEDIRIQLAVSLNNETHHGALIQELYDRITEINGANAVILDTLAENHAFAIREITSELSRAKKENERLRSKGTKILTSKSVDNCV